MAAGRAAELGARTALVEKNLHLGVKLMITGGGRCNVTNSAGLKGFVAAFGHNGKFLYRAFSVFSNQNLISFLAARHVPVRTDPDGKVFPADDRALSVLTALDGYIGRHNVRVSFGQRATGILTSQAHEAEGVRLSEGGVLRAKKIIIAAGGLSYPKTGSTGDGYALAQKMGHTITALRPGLTALESDEPFIKDLQGLPLQNVTITILVNGKKAAAETGDLMFTHFGVSGPTLLVLSGTASDALEAPGNKVEVSLDLMPGLKPEELTAEIQKYFSENGAKIFSSYLKAALPDSLARVFGERCGVDRSRQCACITGPERKRIAALLSDFRIHITRPRPIQEATVTRGGISLGEVDPRTMESRLVKGLYFCGEVLDLDGVTGGFNLQEAFSTGYLAGQSAAEALK
jgi:predicted Rossmann fold flavoprotein